MIIGLHPCPAHHWITWISPLLHVYLPSCLRLPVWIMDHKNIDTYTQTRFQIRFLFCGEGKNEFEKARPVMYLYLSLFLIHIEISK